MALCATGHAMIVAVVLEMLGAHAGRGWRVYRSTPMMDFVQAWVAVGVAVIASLVIYACQLDQAALHLVVS